MGMNMNLNEDFREFLEFLNSNKVEYLVLGGYAVAAHGHPRYTKDIDVWVNPTAENSRRVMAALTEFGFGSIGLTEETFVAPDTIVQLGYPPRRIDLLTEPSGVDSQERYPRRLDIADPHIESTSHRENRSKRSRNRLELQGLGQPIIPRQELAARRVRFAYREALCLPLVGQSDQRELQRIDCTKPPSARRAAPLVAADKGLAT